MEPTAPGPTAAQSSERIVFFSDWHLQPERTPQSDFFVRFVNEVCRGASQVFVLGDLFGAWVGPKCAARPGYAAALDALRSLAGSGTTVTLLRGNRDFLLDRRIAARYGLALTPVVWRGELSGRRVRLSHGDEICERDRLHKLIRALAEHPPVSTIVKALPLRASDRLTDFYRGLSDRRRAKRRTRNLRPDPRRLRREFDSGTDLIIIGHWHEPGVHPDLLSLDDRSLVMLGESTDREACYAELRDGSIELKRFPVRPDPDETT